jgi:hypothetical protein
MLRFRKRKTPLKIRIYYSILAVAIIFTYSVQNRAYAYPGECGLDFLNIPVGAYSASTGQANYAGIEGAEAIFRNPSLIGYNLNAFASYQYLIMDTRSQAAAVNLPLGRNNSFALGVNIFNPGEISGYDDNGQKTGNLSSGDYLVRLGYASQRKLNFGVSFSYYEQRLDNVVGRGYGFGFGLYHDLGQSRLGLSVENLGPEFKIGRSSSPLPTKIAVSGWFPFHSKYINLSTDLIYSLETGFGLAGGLEYSPAEGFNVRLGGNNDVPLSLGLGFTGGNFELDYSYTPSGTFGDRHLFSVSISR